MLKMIFKIFGPVVVVLAVVKLAGWADLPWWLITVPLWWTAALSFGCFLAWIGGRYNG